MFQQGYSCSQAVPGAFSEDLSTDQGFQQVKDRKLTATLCPDFVRTASKLLAIGLVLGLSILAGEPNPQSRWTVGTPVVTYWAGPPMTDATATQMKEGGWNLVWSSEKELDVVQRHGLRAQLTDALLSPSSLDDPAQREKLDALIGRVRSHPALYAYFITDEPNATNFASLGKLVAHLRERDPARLAYINLFPTYATQEQLGNSGDTVTAYKAHLDLYLSTVKPALISYDHYQFTTNGDTGQYFLNLSLIRQAALDAKVPFLNIVQACTWTPSMRVPTGDEMRYLVYTTLAYGAQGISYYVYCHPGHTGGIAHADGSPTPLYGALKILNRDFAAIASQLQGLQSIGVYHQLETKLPGTQPLPPKSAFTLYPVPAHHTPPPPRAGMLLGLFGPAGKIRNATQATHVVLVNLDYRAAASVGLAGPSPLQEFDPARQQWSSAGRARSVWSLAPGDGRLLRVKR